MASSTSAGYGDPQTRERILAATWELLAERGAGTTLGDVAARAEVSRQALYLHFGDRSGLFAALVGHIDAALDLPACLAHVLEATSGAELLRRTMRFTTTFWAAMDPVARVLVRAQDDDEAPAAWRDRMATRREVFSRLAQALSDLGELSSAWTADEAALVLYGVTGHDAWRELTQRLGLDDDEYVELMTRHLVRSLLVEQGRPAHAGGAGRPSRVAGLVLAAGAGRRMGRPKALLVGDEGRAWVSRAVDAVRAGGCDEVVVVVGAAADEVADALRGDGLAGVVRLVHAAQWPEGVGASLRSGLQALLTADDDAAGAGVAGAGVAGAGAAEVGAALVMLVDTPDIGPDVVRRLLGVGGGPGVLARAAYAGRAGHPVLLGREHWLGVVRTASGDRGARDYLRRHRVDLVECADLAGGGDVDDPGDLPSRPGAGR